MSFLAPVATAAAGGLASAGASSLFSSLFGGDSGNVYQPLQRAPGGIFAGGLRSSTDGSSVSLAPDAYRTSAVDNIASTLGMNADQIAQLRAKSGPEFEALRERLRTGTASLRDRLAAETTGLIGRNNAETGDLLARVAPGMSELRKSRLQEIENARLNAIGNLRENMAQRRVLGSSFGQDALTRAESEFGGQKDRAAAESTMAEIEATRQLQQQAFQTDADLMAKRFGADASLFAGETQTDASLFLQKMEAQNQLISQEYQARRGAFQVGLDDLNLQADIATRLVAGASQQMGANARLEAELRSREAAGQGRFFGQTAAPIGAAVSRGVESSFSPSRTSTLGYNPFSAGFTNSGVSA